MWRCLFREAVALDKLKSILLFPRSSYYCRDDKFLKLCNFVFLFLNRGIMNEEEQFVSIDLNDDNICSVCKLGTDKETLSFCHVCFELNIDGKDTG